MPLSGGLPGGVPNSTSSAKPRLGVARTREAQFRVFQAKGREEVLRSIFKHLYAVDETVGSDSAQWGRAAASTGRLQLSKIWRQLTRRDLRGSGATMPAIFKIQNPKP